MYECGDDAFDGVFYFPCLSIEDIGRILRQAEPASIRTERNARWNGEVLGPIEQRFGWNVGRDSYILQQLACVCVPNQQAVVQTGRCQPSAIRTVGE